MGEEREALDFLIDRTDLRRCRVAPAPLVTLEPGAVRLRVDRFAFTSNNITYAVLGESFRGKHQM